MIGNKVRDTGVTYTKLFYFSEGNLYELILVMPDMAVA